MKTSVVLLMVAVVGVTGCSDTTDPTDAVVTLPLGSWAVLQDFGVWNEGFRGYHLAEDVEALPGTEVTAFADGVVMLADMNDRATGYGGLVLIQHDVRGEVVTSLYGHLSSRRRLNVDVGDVVAAGQVIGFIADDDEDGGPWSPHLHFGIRKGPTLLRQEFTEDGGGRPTLCGVWLYVGYTRACTEITHEAHRDFWYHPSNFIAGRGLSP